MLAANVNTNNLIGLSGNNDLHEDLCVYASKSVKHRLEGRLEDSNVGVLINSILLTQTTRANFVGASKHGRRNILVIRLTVHSTENGISKAVTLHQSNRGQLNTVSDITYSKDVVYVGLGVLINRDGTVLTKLHAGLLKTEVLSLGNTTSRKHDTVRLVLITIVGSHLDGLVRVLLNLGRVCVELKLKVGHPRHLVSEVLADVTVKATKEEVATVHKGNLGAKASHDHGKLNGNVATTHNNHALRAFRQVEDLVRGDSEISTRDIRLVRPSTN
mmetsp:Transcript_21505/g.42247  ORF Transcript_21505/g.42247 Transcript_21505/m.42247 type:complete len:273 (+) Transcript_21505:380-1198(+)